jgi:YD repeat-containing protein
VIAGSPTEGEQVLAQRRAKLASPAAVVARERSRTAFEGLSAGAAMRLAGEAFPAVVDHQAGGPPQLPAGQRITGYVNADTARVDLGGGQHGLVQSLAPMAIQTSPKSWSPVDLGVSEAGGAFVAAKPLVGVSIPKRLANGITLTGTSLSLTPVNGSGTPLAGAGGAVDGATVLYANTQTDTDTVVKPTTLGFEVDTLLRSTRSPQRLSFRVGMPGGARLVHAKGGSGAVDVVKEGVTIAAIPAPAARDAAGTPVPVSMNVSGNTLTLTVDHRAGSYLYPVAVDPELEFNTKTDSTLSTKTWEFASATGGFVKMKEKVGFEHSGAYVYGQRGEVYYRTNGDSRIYEVNGTAEFGTTGYDIEGKWENIFEGRESLYLEFESSSGPENHGTIAEYGMAVPVPHTFTLCAKAGSGCSSADGSEHNLVRLASVLTSPSGGEVNGDGASLESATVSISQPKETHSTVGYNTSSVEVDGQPNVLHTGGWLGPDSGALEFKAKDLGLGVAEVQFEWYENGIWKQIGGTESPDVKKYLGTSNCAGIQCASSESESLDYANLLSDEGRQGDFEWNGLADGEDRIRFSADDPMEHTWSSEHGEGEAIIKVDHTPPHGITVTGLPSNGKELKLGEVEAHLKVEATDGEGSVPSAGIKSLALGVEGKEIGKPAGYCSPGPCTASAEWSLNGAELGAGTYTLTVVATDNAGNVESANYTLSVYHASPVAMGPGSVNPESGDFALGASDVGASGGSGSLAVTRHYDSRNLREGEEGPLGPQWTVSLGNLASLEVLPDGSVMTAGPEGLTFFKIKTGGGFEAPTGDTDLTLEYESKNKEYLLKDAAKGTTTRFTLPSGAKTWMPTVSDGPAASDTMTDTYETAEAVNEYALPAGREPWGIAAGPDGNLWFTDVAAGKIGKMMTSGVATEYSLPSGSEPTGIVSGPEGDLWYVNGGGEIGKITTAGVATEYALHTSSVLSIAVGPEGDLWFTSTEGKVGKVTAAGEVTKYTAGSDPQRITAGPEGDMWFTNDGCANGYGGTCGVDKIIPQTGQVTAYPLTVEPVGITAGPDGNLWYAAVGKIGKITPSSGEVKEYSLPSESIATEITTGPDGNLWYTNWNKIGKITTSGAITEFSLPSGSKPNGIIAGPDGNLWFTERGTSKIGKISTSGVIVEPKLELAPHPSATCSREQLEKREITAKGCRALEFTYAKETTAKGESKSEWGEYRGRLKEVHLIAYNPSTKAMAAPVVAKYEYDKLGRLRAEWDPEVPSELKTIYGYDAEGHVTALTSPGQESWAFTYGTIPGDSSTGRLLKVTRAPASGGLWSGEVVKNTEAPKITGTPTEGVRLAVSNGTWSGGPMSYVYQWEDCNLSGGECAPIPGATNANYTPVKSDVGHMLVVEVTATNGGGSATERITTSAEVTTRISEYHVSEEAGPFAMTLGPDGNVWFVDSHAEKVGKITTGGVVSEYQLPTGTFAWGVAPGPDGNLWLTTSKSPASKIEKMTTSGTISAEYSLPKESNPEGITTGPEKEHMWFTEPGTGKIGKITTSGTITEYALPEKSEPHGIASGPDGNLWFTEPGTSMIGKITTSGTITEYALPAKSKPQGITVGPEKEDLWFTDEGTGEIGKITTSGTITEYSLPKGSGPYGITAGPDGNVWFTDNGTGKIGKITTSGAITEYSLPKESYPHEIVTGSNKNMWFADFGSSKIGTISPSPSEGEAKTPGPGTTIEYNVPLWGEGAPDTTAKTEAEEKVEREKWGQKDDPEYATAIFPPDESQGWPATGYKRATINYMDSQARTVNVASPSGGVSTSEYNAENAVTRTLGADNRAAAMNEGCISVAKKECKSAEVSELLDTKSAYNAEGQLTDTWGPQHTVKLAVGKEGKSGEEVPARNHVKYFYDEGAPGGETYDLVTKTIDGAETASKEEFDKRTTTTSYGGQSNLGWKLREPTSTTIDPGGLNLTTTTKYEENSKGESTGNVVETKSPEGTSGGQASPSWAYASQFGNTGSESEKLSYPSSDAVDANGDVWVTDAGQGRVEEFTSAGSFLKDFGTSGTGSDQFKVPVGIAINASTKNIYISDWENNRIDELNEKGGFVKAFGYGVSNGESKLQTCTTSCKAGISGAAAGQLAKPDGLTIDSSGNVWVADYANDRVDEFNEKGEFIAAFGFGVSNGEAKLQTCTTTCKAGASGSGNGQFNGPTDLVFSGGNLYVVDQNNDRVQEFNTSREYVTQFGTKGNGNVQFSYPGAIAADSHGNLYVVDGGNNRIQELTASGTFLTAFGSVGSGNGQFSSPEGVAIGSVGDVYVADAGNHRMQEWIPSTTGNVGAHDTKTAYYSSEGESEVEECRGHPEWAGLPCETQPAAQPGVSGLPELPVTTIKYNIWDQPETTEETFGSGTGAKKRIKKTTYEASGRPLTTEVTSSIDTELPKVSDKYNATSGMLEEQSTTVGTTTKTVTSKYNTLGQVTEYTDASGNTATFEYEGEGSYKGEKELDGRLRHMSDKKGSQTYHYNETTGALSELVDSAAGPFKAEYDVAGRMTTETYPNAMTATYTHNQVGETTGIEYKKTAHCEKTCPEVWFSDAVVPSIHGETLKQTSTLSEEPSYTYDAAGRLTQAQEIPAGEGCKTRIYAYDEDGNRTSETSREPGTEGKCAPEGGSTEWHTYDTADSLADPNVTYETFGNTTKLPASDAGGSALTSEYYVDGQVFKQSQGEGESEQKLEYKLDPEERTLETVSSGKTKSTVISHYDGSGSAVAWTGEGSGETEKWTRNIPGIDGTLTATQEGEGKTGKSVTLLLHDLQGDVVGTVGVSEAETKLLTKYNSTEFGVPSGKGAPPKYGWLGAAGVAGELPSGVITQDGVTYVPQTGRPLQTEGVVLPALQNAATPFSRSFEAWVGSKAGEGAARELAKAKQIEEEREAANQPPGSVPLPEGEFCGEGYGSCAIGGGFLSGSEMAESGCGGGNACAASAPSCILHWLFGQEKDSPGILQLAGNMECNKKMSSIAFQECELVDKNGKYDNLRCTKKGWTSYKVSEAGAYLSDICIEGEDYKAWVWAKALSENFFSVGHVNSGEWTCEGFYGEQVVEAVETLLP